MIHRIQSDNLNPDPPDLALSQMKPALKGRWEALAPGEMAGKPVLLQRIVRDEEEPPEDEATEAADEERQASGEAGGSTAAGGNASEEGEGGGGEGGNVSPPSAGANSRIFLRKWYETMQLVITAFSLILVN